MGELAALASAFIWAGTSVAMASLTLRVTPLAMSALRLAFATLVMPLALLLSGQAGEIADAPWSAIIGLIGSGILAYAIGDTVYIGSLGVLGVQRAFTITMTLFITLTVAGGVLLLDESFSAIQGAGTVLVAAGIWLLARTRSGPAGRPPLSSSEARAGYLLIVFVAITWSAATLWLADARGDLGSVAAWAVRTPAAAVAVGAFALAFAPRDLASPFHSRRQITAVALVGLIGTAFGSLLYVFAVGEAGAGRTTVLTAASPLMTIPLSVFFLHEPFTRAAALGTAVCTAGVVFVVL